MSGEDSTALRKRHPVVARGTVDDDCHLLENDVEGDFLEAAKKRKRVLCEICLNEGLPAVMHYHGGDQWTHTPGGECWVLFIDHIRNIDKRSISELLLEVTQSTSCLAVFQSTRGGDREYSVRALQEARSQAVVALHRRLRIFNWILRKDSKYLLSRELTEILLYFVGGSLRKDITPIQEPGVLL